jgi:DtxR family Mn-dependent transcriptional regulator
MRGSEGRRLDLSEAQEDYLKQILALGGSEASVATQALADHLGVRPASATGMVQRLAALGLVRHTPYHGATLSPAGRRVALEMVRHHRLLETYLTRFLGYPWEDVHAEAERLEHVISEGFEARIAELLDHPSRDPHGDPIPDADLVLPPEPETVSLADAPVSRPLRLVRVTSQDRATLSRVAALGLWPGHPVRVVGRSRAGLRVAVAGRRAAVPRALATLLQVEIVEAAPARGGSSG